MSDVVEQHTIRAIPGSARHGSARDLLPFWFTVNASVYMIGLGGFVAEFRLGLWPTIAAIVAGAAVGGAFMAAHSVQGPRLGVPQLVQSRAQFGFYGALLPNAAIWLLLLSTLVAADVTAGARGAGHRRRGDHGGQRLCRQRDFGPAADRHHRSRRTADVPRDPLVRHQSRRLLPGPSRPLRRQAVLLCWRQEP